MVLLTAVLNSGFVLLFPRLRQYPNRYKPYTYNIPSLNRMTKKILVSTLLFLSYSYNSSAQVAKKVVENFKSLKNLTYTSTVREKDFFSDKISYDTTTALISVEQTKMKSFKIKGINQEEIFDGNKLFKINLNDSTYRVSLNTENSLYFYRSLPYFVKEIEESVMKQKSIIQLADSILNGISYYYLHITNLDSIKNGKRIFNLASLLVDKKTYLPYYYKSAMQGFIDGTNTFLTTFSEYYFSDYKINNKAFPDLTVAQVPSYFTLEKPKKSLPLLKSGTKAPDVGLSYADGSVFNLEKEKGKIVLLNFTVNGCPHCVEAIETLNRLFAKYKSGDFRIVSINAYDTNEAVLKYNRRFNVEYPTFIKSDNMNKILEDYHIDGYPTFYLIDKAGNIAKSFSGYYATLEKELISSIDKLNEL